MAKPDLYATLGTARNASADDLKRAYRKLAMQYHPDRNPNDKTAEAKFRELSEAYDILKDDQKRAAYDRYGHAIFEQAGAGGAGGGFEANAADLGDMFDQMFGNMMGGRRGGGAARRGGADIRQAIEIDLPEAFSGTKVNLRVPTRVVCDACNGSGSEDRGKTAEMCGTCNGMGKVRAQQGFFLIERTCPTCNGSGKVVRNPCSVCHGAGTVSRERTLQVQIPAGVEDGTRIRLAGEGEAGAQSQPPGDLYVHVGVRPHPLFQRAEANVLVRVPLRMTQAALGGDIEVPVIDGSRARVKVPPGTQTGDQFRLRGKGFSIIRSTQRGDMFVQVAVETPQQLTRKQRELLEAFEADVAVQANTVGGAKGHPESEGFFTKVKDFFESGGP